MRVNLAIVISAENQFSKPWRGITNRSRPQGTDRAEIRFENRSSTVAKRTQHRLAAQCAIPGSPRSRSFAGSIPPNARTVSPRRAANLREIRRARAGRCNRRSYLTRLIKNCASANRYRRDWAEKRRSKTALG